MAVAHRWLGMCSEATKRTGLFGAVQRESLIRSRAPPLTRNGIVCTRHRWGHVMSRKVMDLYRLGCLLLPTNFKTGFYCSACHVSGLRYKKKTTFPITTTQQDAEIEDYNVSVPSSPGRISHNHENKKMVSLFQTLLSKVVVVKCPWIHVFIIPDLLFQMRIKK